MLVLNVSSVVAALDTVTSPTTLMFVDAESFSSSANKILYAFTLVLFCVDSYSNLNSLPDMSTVKVHRSAPFVVMFP